MYNVFNIEGKMNIHEACTRGNLGELESFLQEKEETSGQNAILEEMEKDKRILEEENEKGEREKCTDSFR